MCSRPVWRAALACLAFLSVSGLRAADEKPVHHIVIFQFNETTTPAQAFAVSQEFSKLSTKIEGIQSLQWGTNNSPEGLNDGLTHAFCLTFENQAKLDAYGPHAAHQEFVKLVRAHVGKVFVNDFAIEKPASIAEIGRNHHLVFFKYKEGTTAEKKAEISKAFLELESKIPGVLSIQTGEDRTPEKHQKGFVPFWLTFTNERARDDYLPHPAHKEFVELVVPNVEKPVVFDFTVRPSSRSLFVTSGLEPYMVVQRDDKNQATLNFGGVCSAEGSVEARILLGRRTLPGFDWKVVGKAVGGEFTATIPGVPVGGEYTVEIRRRDAVGNVAEHTDVANLLVGDLWILAGQSNM
ncbi:MAG: Dabb family protein, partial [Planctomycetota bacterium]